MSNKKKSYALNEIEVGMSASSATVITDEKVRKFAELSGDNNPVHLDEKYAETSRFKRRIAHGLLSASFFSALFGTELPGQGCVYASQNLQFKRAVYLGDTVVATVTVTAVHFAEKRVSFDTVCTVKGKKVIDGSAEIFIP
jgi:3-hydroxybutyryl-CoA dehydratase